MKEVAQRPLCRLLCRIMISRSVSLVSLLGKLCQPSGPRMEKLRQIASRQEEEIHAKMAKRQPCRRHRGNSLQGTAQACPDSRRTATLHKQCVNGNQTHKQGTQGSTFAQYSRSSLVETRVRECTQSTWGWLIRRILAGLIITMRQEDALLRTQTHRPNAYILRFRDAWELSSFFFSCILPSAKAPSHHETADSPGLCAVPVAHRGEGHS